MREKAKRDGPSTGILFRYVLFQLPGWTFMLLTLLLIDRWMDLSVWSALSIVLFWIAKDLILFPFVWRAYDQNPARIAAYRMIGERAVAKERLSPSGYVQVHGELWRAELMPDSSTVEEGQPVRVEEVRGLTLFVQPEK